MTIGLTDEEAAALIRQLTDITWSLPALALHPADRVQLIFFEGLLDHVR